jgi:hypothetical protein
MDRVLTISCIISRKNKQEIIIMAMYVSEFWQGVREQKHHIKEMLSTPEQAHQPKTGQSVWLCSIKSRAENTTAGNISEALIPRAAECLYRQSHRLCTADELAAYQKSQEEQRKLIERMERNKRNVIVVGNENA